MDVSACRRGHEFNFHLFLKRDSAGMAGSRRRSFHLSLQFHWDTRSRGPGMHGPLRHVVPVLLAVQTEHLLEALSSPEHGRTRPGLFARAAVKHLYSLAQFRCNLGTHASREFSSSWLSTISPIPPSTFSRIVTGAFPYASFV